MILSIIGWMIMGLIVGAIARFVVPGPDPMGIFGTIALGVAGAFLGGFLGSLFSGDGASFEPAGWIGAFVGALILVIAIRRFSPRPRVR